MGNGALGAWGPKAWVPSGHVHRGLSHPRAQPWPQEPSFSSSGRWKSQARALSAPNILLLDTPSSP